MSKCSRCIQKSNPSPVIALKWMMCMNYTWMKAVTRKAYLYCLSMPARDRVVSLTVDVFTIRKNIELCYLINAARVVLRQTVNYATTERRIWYPIWKRFAISFQSTSGFCLAGDGVRHFLWYMPKRTRTVSWVLSCGEYSLDGAKTSTGFTRKEPADFIRTTGQTTFTRKEPADFIRTTGQTTSAP